MKVVFFGIYRLGVEALAELVKRGIDIAAVVTKAGTPTDPQPVAEAARQYQLPCLLVQSPRDSRFLEAITELAPELIVVAGYHRILPKALLDIPRRGAVNLHPSLLPQYRGPCPWKWTIVNGETITGATVHVVSEKVDAGDILAQ